MAVLALLLILFFAPHFVWQFLHLKFIYLSAFHEALKAFFLSSCHDSYYVLFIKPYFAIFNTHHRVAIIENNIFLQLKTQHQSNLTLYIVIKNNKPHTHFRHELKKKKHPKQQYIPDLM